MKEDWRVFLEKVESLYENNVVDDGKILFEILVSLKIIMVISSDGLFSWYLIFIFKCMLLIFFVVSFKIIVVFCVLYELIYFICGVDICKYF